MQTSVYVKSIRTKEGGGIIVEACNGGPEGPPFVRFELPSGESRNCTINKRYLLTVEEANG